MSIPASQAVFTVSQLNQRAKQLLEISFTGIRVEGEISSLSRPASGHWYFTLKDSGAQVRCAMFRSSAQRLRFMPKEGDQVELRGKVSLYENRGDYQLIVDAMKPAGEGALLQAFEQLKQRLLVEGLFDASHKKPLPQNVRRVALITSATGAAVHDMISVFARRSPDIAIDVYPAQVQGQAAVGELIHALARVQRDHFQRNAINAIVIGRGGGSLEDLWCFNDEALAREVFACQLPIISAVGHETDTTICDFVADLRAPTPTAAAELLSPDRSQQSLYLAQLRQRLLQAQRQRLQQQQHSVFQLRQRLQSPQHLLQSRAQQCDQLDIRLRQSMQTRLQRARQQLNAQQNALQQQDPQRILSEYRQRLNNCQQQLQQQMQHTLQENRQSLALQAQLLNSFSPLKVLGRGYSLTRDSDGNVIDDASAISNGQQVTTLLNQGELVCQVIETRSDNALQTQGEN